jgi:hypothetical protein
MCCRALIFILEMYFSRPLSLWLSFSESYLLERVRTRAHTHPTTHAHTHKYAHARTHTHTLIRRQTHTPSLSVTYKHPPTHTDTQPLAHNADVHIRNHCAGDRGARPPAHAYTIQMRADSFVWAERAHLYCVRRRVCVDM